MITIDVLGFLGAVIGQLPGFIAGLIIGIFACVWATKAMLDEGFKWRGW